jgi:glycosyltransferase involved in cell wall biosynthesis
VNTICMFSMVKNEADFIEKFLDHNAPIFDKVVIIDNGSDDGTLEILMARQSEKFKVVEFKGSFKRKGPILSEEMNKVEADILFPVDADELIIYDDGERVSRNPSTTRNYLQNMELCPEGCRYRVRETYQKLPNSEEEWAIKKISKVFFTKKAFEATDTGNHGGRMSWDAPWLTSNISFLDYRYQSREYWEKRTIQKLRGQLGPAWRDREFLKRYEGINSHAAKEYLQYHETGRWCRRAKGDVVLKFEN